MSATVRYCVTSAKLARAAHQDCYYTSVIAKYISAYNKANSPECETYSGQKCFAPIIASPIMSTQIQCCANGISATFSSMQSCHCPAIHSPAPTPRAGTHTKWHIDRQLDSVQWWCQERLQLQLNNHKRNLQSAANKYTNGFKL